MRRREIFTKLSVSFLGAMVLFGCATLSGRKEILSVDSEPRGMVVEVPEAGDGFKAATPFFVELPRARKHEFRLLNGASTTTEEVSCRFRWFPTIAGNAALALASLTPAVAVVTYGVGLAVDSMTGATRSCLPRIVLSPSSTSGEAMGPTAECHRLLLIPVGADDPAAAWKYESSWLAYRRVNPNGCERLVAHGDADEELGHYGFLEQESLQKSRKRLQKHALSLGLATGASHFLLVSANGDDATERFVAEKYDAHTLELVEAPEWNREEWEKVAKPSAPIWSSTKWMLLKVVPNSFGFSVGKVSLVDREAPFRNENSIRSLLLDTIRHPAQYNQWDISFDWVSDVSLQWLELSSKASGKITAFEVAGSFGGETTVHTLLGAVSLNLRGGVMDLVSREERVAGWVNDGAPFYRVGAAYRAFFTEDLFFQGKLDMTFLLKKLDVGKRNSADSIVSGEVGVGFYLPDVPLWMGRRL
jgi:hypothetical protein